MAQFKRFNASENDNYDSSSAFPEGTLTWDPSNGLRIHDGSTSGGNSVGGTSTGNVTFDGVKVIGAGSASGDGNSYSTLEIVPDNNLYSSNQYLIVDPTAPGHIHIRAGGTQDSSSAELILGGETSHVKIGSGSNPTVYIKSNDNQWTFGTDGNLTAPGNILSTSGTFTTVGDNDIVIRAEKGLGAPGGPGFVDWTFGVLGDLTLPEGGDILDSNGNSVLGAGSGTTLPADASGYLNNNGSGTLSWVAGNPTGSGMLPYNGVTVLSNTVTADWTEYTLSGTMDAFYDWNSAIATITLSSQTAYGKEITVNTKNLWINDSKINSNDYLVVEFPATPSVGDVFSVPVVNILTTVNAGSFVVGETYTIVSMGTTAWTSIGATYSGVGQSFVATGIGSGTGTATTTTGAKKLVFKPASGHRAQTMAQGQLGPIIFGQGGTYNFMYVDLAGQNASNPLTWVYAGLIGGIPTWYQFYF